MKALLGSGTGRIVHLQRLATLGQGVKGCDEGLGGSESCCFLRLSVDDGLHVGLARCGTWVPFLRSRPSFNEGKSSFLDHILPRVVVPDKGSLGSFTGTSRCDGGSGPGGSLVSSGGSSICFGSIATVEDALEVSLSSCRAEVLPEVLLHVGQSGVRGRSDHFGRGRDSTGPQTGGVVNVGGGLLGS